MPRANLLMTRLNLGLVLLWLAPLVVRRQEQRLAQYLQHGSDLVQVSVLLLVP
jgi:hypothetical protein